MDKKLISSNGLTVQIFIFFTLIVILHDYDLCQIFLLFYLQVLSQVTPNPNDVKREVALHCPDKNRSMDFLPRESQYDQLYSL